MQIVTCVICNKQKHRTTNEVCYTCSNLSTPQEQWEILDTICKSVALCLNLESLPRDLLIHMVYYMLPYTDGFKIAFGDEIEIAIIKVIDGLRKTGHLVCEDILD